MTITAAAYRTYRKAYPYINQCRGATRLMNALDTRTLNQLEPYSGDPTPITEWDWDNLLILDGCRHDLYEEVCGPTPKRVTVASSSPSYFQKTFTTGDYNDVVYVSANPHIHRFTFQEATGRQADDVFHAVYHTYLDKWDDENKTVLPESVTADARTAQNEHPDKRKIVHFMQPHHPFLCAELTGSGHVRTPDDNGGFSVWDAAEQGRYSRDELWKAYRANLEYVLPYVHDLAADLPGKTVVTADHGNLVGENGRYGHPQGCDAQPLREVPWHEL